MPDLRTIKTKKSIENAFLELRQKKNLEDIKVSELCSIALINKTTFYNYYSDIYELSNELGPSCPWSSSPACRPRRQSS